MEYYLLPVEESEAVAFEEALKKIDYDIDDRASIWTKEDIDKIINTMTKENASKLIVEFLPDPVGDKFANLFGIKFNQSSS
ncbi:MAG: hypothetical protein JO297_17610 [Nitrososphaeraceae archaeon]|nr:hypothetical protein [Nitrososphaeraceae archaeon]